MTSQITSQNGTADELEPLGADPERTRSARDIEEKSEAGIEDGAARTMASIPEGFERVRSTPVFDQDSIPAGLLAAHQVASGVWGHAVVESGVLQFRFEDESTPRLLGAGESVVIAPLRPHHVTPVEHVTFRVDFYRATKAAIPDTGS